MNIKEVNFENKNRQINIQTKTEIIVVNFQKKKILKSFIVDNINIFNNKIQIKEVREYVLSNKKNQDNLAKIFIFRKK